MNFTGVMKVMFGRENRDWIYCVVDPVEWSEPRYNHQN